MQTLDADKQQSGLCITCPMKRNEMKMFFWPSPFSCEDFIFACISKYGDTIHVIIKDLLRQEFAQMYQNSLYFLLGMII